MPLPKWIAPCVPTLVDKAPTGREWVHEIKWDGYRISAYVEAGAVTIRTRNGYDWTTRFPTIAAALATLKVRSAIIDGEAVILDSNGKSSFAKLQAALTKHGADDAIMYAFDILFLDGEDMRHRRLEERLAALLATVKSESPIFISEPYVGEGADFFQVACKHELEGIVSKRLNSQYRSGKSRSWLKTKCVKSDAFIVIGYQLSSSLARALANLQLATFDGKKLQYVGSVGTGFSAAVASSLLKQLETMRTFAPLATIFGADRALSGIGAPGSKVRRAIFPTIASRLKATLPRAGESGENARSASHSFLIGSPG